MATIIMLKNGNEYEPTAWTGGDAPNETAKENPDFRMLRSWFFRKELKNCGGLDFFKFTHKNNIQFPEDKAQFDKMGYFGTGSMERARIFWNRASLDAWRTLQHPVN